jgi:cysteine synthase
MVAAVKGYPAVFVMSADMSEERKSILLAYGATLVLTPAEKGTVGAIEEARRLEKEHGYFFVGQHFNPANPLSHETTATEILEDFGVDLGAVICTTGTGGTVSGISPILRSAIPDVQIIVTEPDESPMLSKGIGGKHRIMGTRPALFRTRLIKTRTIRSSRLMQMMQSASLAGLPRKKVFFVAYLVGRPLSECSNMQNRKKQKINNF